MLTGPGGVVRARAARGAALCMLLSACASPARQPPRSIRPEPVPPRAELTLPPAWTRGAVCYEVFVRSFYDSDGDGIGDLRGLTEKLDYINDGDSTSTRDLGASCVWLMPVAESPSYHGYDVSDYYHVNPDYGTTDDFLRFVAEAHRRGIRVLVDMVLNHSSSQHPNFEAALHDSVTPYRTWYRFSPKPLGKGPWGEVAWHRSPVRDEYYYGVFSSEMPDLDYHTPEVREEAKRIAKYWLESMGVDGFRLDAVPYLVEDDGCQIGCDGTHDFLREYAAYIRGIAPEAYTVGEVWGGIDTLLPYYPDQLTSYFAFELADSLISVVNDGNAAGLLPGYLRLQRAEPGYRWSPILSNHDGTRSMTRFGGDMARAKQAATLLLTLPGLPFVYYGEEIGMTGDKPDPRLRTPMQWEAKTGVGFTSGIPWESPQPDSLAVNVAAQEGDATSLLGLYRRLIHLRRSNEALATGELVPLQATDAHVAAYIRRSGDHAVLVVANLGATPVTAPSLSSSVAALAKGGYEVVDLLGRGAFAVLHTEQDGQISGYAPVAAELGPHETLVLDLVRRKE
jgi:glycosidase